MQYFKRNINLFIVIILFIILCVSYILTVPVFEAPDEDYHFLYAFYISKYDRVPSKYNEPISANQYVKDHTDDSQNPMFFIDEKYALYKQLNGGYKIHSSSSHHPPLYYLISSQIIKPFSVDNLGAEYNYENFNEPNRFINNKILRDRSPTIALVLILRFAQTLYGVMIIFFIIQIIKLLTNNKIMGKSILIISSIAFLPQFIFLCSYINNDLLSGLFGLISIYFIILLFKRERTYFGLFSIFFAIIATFTKFTLFVIIPVVIVTFLMWLIIKRKLRILLSFFIVVVFAILVFYYVLNFQEITYSKSEIETGWAEGCKYGNLKSNNNSSISEKNVAFSFDGIDDRVIVSSIPSSAVTELTVESRVFIRSFNKSGVQISTPIISDWNLWTSDSKKGYLLRVIYIPWNDELRWQFLICNGSNHRALSYDILPYNDFSAKYSNKWLHVSGVFKGKEYLKILINGEVVATVETNIPAEMVPEKSTPIYFSFSGTNPGYTKGIIDEIRIWDIACTETQIKNNMKQKLTGNEQGLIGHWEFNEGEGSIVHDSTENKNHGEILVTIEKSFPLIDRIKKVWNETVYNREDTFKFDKEDFINSFKSSVAVFGWMKIFADPFIYYFLLTYIVAGIILFFVNMKEYSKSRRSIIFIISTIISVYAFFFVFAFYTNWEQNQGRTMFIAVVLTFILAILGYNTVKTRYKNILYYVLFSCSLFISVFCLYKYIYLQYY